MPARKLQSIWKEPHDDPASNTAADRDSVANTLQILLASWSRHCSSDFAPFGSNRRQHILGIIGKMGTVEAVAPVSNQRKAALVGPAPMRAAEAQPP